MTEQRWHILEKIQVQIAAVAALAIMYFVFWRWIKPEDVNGVATFIPLHAYGHLITFALFTWLLAAGVAVITTTSRPQGALLATLVGAGGVSLHTQPMRLLLMQFSPPATLMRPLIVEMVCMAAIVMVAAAIIQLVRAVVQKIHPPIMRPNVLMSEGSHGGEARENSLLVWLLTGQKYSSGLLARTAAQKSEISLKDVFLTAGGCLAITVIIALLLMEVTIFEVQRGQLLFGVAISFFVGAAVGTYFMPINFCWPCWLAAILIGGLCYVKGCAVVDTGVLTWTHMDYFTNILPVDWLSAACGGAVGGFWLARRLHDLKFSSHHEKQPAAKAAAS